MLSVTAVRQVCVTRLENGEAYCGSAVVLIVFVPFTFTKLDYTPLLTILTEYSMGTAKTSRFCGNVSSFSQDSVWSWFICLCSSICMMLTLGFSFALGVLFPVLMDSFNENRERTGKMDHFITYFKR